VEHFVYSAEPRAFAQEAAAETTPIPSRRATGIPAASAMPAAAPPEPISPAASVPDAEAPKRKRASKKPALAAEDAWSLAIDMPTPGPRMRTAKRLTMFYDLGRITHCDAEAARIFGIEAAAIGRDLPAGDLLPEEELFRSYLAESVGENRDGAPFFWDGSADGLVSCSLRLEKQSAAVTRVTLTVSKP
jgi:hypothetical protein